MHREGIVTELTQEMQEKIKTVTQRDKQPFYQEELIVKGSDECNTSTAGDNKK